MNSTPFSQTVSASASPDTGLDLIVHSLGAGFETMFPNGTVAGPEFAFCCRMTFFSTCGPGISFLLLEIKVAGLGLATHLPCLRLLNINVRACVCWPVAARPEALLQCPNSGAVAGSQCSLRLAK